jgi:hypothetical protein
LKSLSKEYIEVDILQAKLTRWLAAASLLMLVSSAALADESLPGAGRIGVGLSVGSMFLITGNYWLSDRASIDFGLGVDQDPGTLFYGNYLWHMPQLFGTTTQFTRQTNAYFGLGGGLGVWSHNIHCTRWGCNNSNTNAATEIYVHALFGAEWRPSAPAFGVFAELGPSIGLIPYVGGTVDVQVGGRYYF